MRGKCPKIFLVNDLSEIVKDKNLKFDTTVTLEKQMHSLVSCLILKCA